MASFILSNTYGHPNVGDEAILTSMILELRKFFPTSKITVLSLYPKLTTQKHPQVTVLESGVFRGLWQTFQAIGQADLLIVGGGGILQDTTSLGNLLFHLSRIVMALLNKTPFCCYAIGVGPIKSPIGRFLTKQLLCYSEIITVRDQYSFDLLLEVGVPKSLLRLTADPAFILRVSVDSNYDEPHYRQIKHIKEQGHSVIVLSLRPLPEGFNLLPKEKINYSYSLLNEFVALAKYFIEKHNSFLVFVSMHPDQDDKLGHLLGKKIHNSDRVLIVPGSISPQKILALISLADMVIAMRLHTLIFASSCSVPVVALAYQPKVAGFMNALGQEKNILYPPDWKFGSLKNIANYTWLNRLEIAQSISKRVTYLYQQSEKNIKFIQTISNQIKTIHE